MWVQTDCRVRKYWQTDKQTVKYVSTDRLILDLTHQGRFDKIWNHRPNNVTYWIATFDQKLNMRWTKDPTCCQSAAILKVYQILMYKILRVGTHAIHFVVFKAHYYFNFHLQTTLRLFVLLCLVRPAAYGIMNSQPILLQRLNKNNDKPRANCFRDKNADKLPSLRGPSGRRLASFVRPWASLPRTTKDKTAYCCTPIINGKIIFSRTLMCYLQRSWACDPEDSKSKPMVWARERRADGEPSPVLGRGHISWMMLYWWL